jgi:hypothetical protein
MSQRPSRGSYNGSEFEDEDEFEDDKLPTMIGGGLRSLAAAGSPKPTPFDGADGADALQGIGPQWPFGRSTNDRWS